MSLRTSADEPRCSSRKFGSCSSTGVVVSGTTDVVDEVDGVVATVVGVGARSRRGGSVSRMAVIPTATATTSAAADVVTHRDRRAVGRVTRRPWVGRHIRIEIVRLRGSSSTRSRLSDSETSTTSRARPPRTALVRQSPSSASTIVRSLRRARASNDVVASTLRPSSAATSATLNSSTTCSDRAQRSASGSAASNSVARSADRLPAPFHANLGWRHRRSCTCTRRVAGLLGCSI